MEKFKGFYIPASYRASEGLNEAVELFNDGLLAYCGGCCGDWACRDCIGCANYYPNNADEKIQAFGDYAVSQGYVITRPDYRHGSSCATTPEEPDNGDIEEEEEEEKRECEFCGEMFTAEHDEELCPSCQEDYDNGELVKCYWCGKYTRDYVTTEDTNHDFCVDCVDQLYRCCDCGDYFEDSDNIHSDDYEHDVCDSCFDNYWDRCSNCERLISRDDTYYSDDGDCYCCDCLPREACTDTIHDYSYDPPDFRFGKTTEDEDNPVFLGFELEAGDADADDVVDAAEYIDSITDEAYLKKDSSIPKHGFELVSHPLTYLYHKNECVWEDCLDKMRSKGLLSHDASSSCGLHVHVNREALTPDQWLIVDWFIHREQHKWECIARRSRSSYAQFKHKPKDAKLKDVYGKGSERYSAVNFCNRNTVEFRLFRGTLKYYTFIATLGLVDALIKWAKHVKTHDILCSGAWESFVDVIKAEPKYEPALAYLKSKELVKED